MFKVTELDFTGTTIFCGLDVHNEEVAYSPIATSFVL